jgi:hypothetical protein
MKYDSQERSSAAIRLLRLLESRLERGFFALTPILLKTIIKTQRSLQ